MSARNRPPEAFALTHAEKMGASFGQMERWIGGNVARTDIWSGLDRVVCMQQRGTANLEEGGQACQERPIGWAKHVRLRLRPCAETRAHALDPTLSGERQSLREALWPNICESCDEQPV